MRSSSSRASWQSPVVLAGVLLVTLFWMLLVLRRGWIPHDEGQMAQQAERILEGQLPHVDFDDMYSGGLGAVHALTFRILGARMVSLRIPLLLGTLVFVGVLQTLAVRFLAPIGAALLTLTALAWSVPVYVAPVPTWYNLFLTVVGIACFVRFLDTGRRLWLAGAGATAGISITVKIVGLFPAAAVFLTLLYLEQEEHSVRQGRADGEGTPPQGEEARGVLASVIVCLSAAVVLAGPALLISRRPGPMELIHFVLPTAALAGFVAWNELRVPRGPSAPRLRRLASLVSAFGLGAAVPLALFVLPYIQAHALPALFRGIFVLPQLRFRFASMSFPPPWTLVAALPAALLTLAPRLARRLPGRGVMLLALPVAAVVAAATDGRFYRMFWYGARPLVLVVALGTVALLAGAGGKLLPERRRVEVFLLGCTASLFGLIQFPYPFGPYFCYAAPVLALALGAILAPEVRGLSVLFASAHLAFGLLWLSTGWVRSLGVAWVPWPPVATSAVEPCGLRIPDRDAGTYRELVTEIARHSPPGASIYATPDCPEVYFLSGRRNPTSTTYDFMESDFGSPETRTSRLMTLLSSRDVRLVVLADLAEFSGPIAPGLRRELEVRYPRARRVGRFVVRWTS